jgi:ribosome-associated protein
MYLSHTRSKTTTHQKIGSTTYFSRWEHPYPVVLARSPLTRYIYHMLRITSNLFIDENELEERFVRSSGPGGQNVNKVSTAVQLRLNVAGSASIPEDVKERLARIAGKMMTVDGMLIIEARRFRTQERNRRDARDRLVSLLRRALLPQKQRRPTRPTKASLEERLRRKSRTAQLKQTRGRRWSSED